MRNPEEYLRELVKDEKIETVLDVGTGHSGVFDYGRWESLPLKLKVTTDIQYLRPDIPNWHKIICSMMHLPFLNSNFDLVQCTEVIEHVPPQFHEQALKELKRVSRKIVYVTTSAIAAHRGSEQEAIEKLNPYCEYEVMPQVDDILKAGFKIILHLAAGERSKILASWIIR